MAYSYQVFDTEDFETAHSQPTPSVPTETSNWSGTYRGSSHYTAKPWSEESQFSSTRDKYDTLSYSRNVELFFYVVLMILLFAVLAIAGIFVAYQFFGGRGRATQATIHTENPAPDFTVRPTWPTFSPRTVEKKSSSVGPVDTTTVDWVTTDTSETANPTATVGSTELSATTFETFASMRETDSTISESTGSFPTSPTEEPSKKSNDSIPMSPTEELSTEGTASIPTSATEEESTESRESTSTSATQEESTESRESTSTSATEEGSTESDVTSLTSPTEQEEQNTSEIVSRERHGEEPIHARSSVPPKSLICTFGSKMNESTAFPPDGLCSFVFFDSLYSDQLNRFGENLQPNMLYFLRHARKYSKTTYGVGLDFESSAEVEKFLYGDMARATLADYISKGIHHYGCINTPVTPKSPSDVKGSLRVLQKVDSLISGERKINMPLYTAMAASLWSEKWFEEFSLLFKDVFTPDIVIMYGHLFSEDQGWKNCRIVPPTLMSVPRSGPYLYSLRSAHEDMEALERTGIQATLAVSVAMFGRWYEPQYPDFNRPSEPGNFSLYKKCKWTSQDQLGSKTEVCKSLIWRGKMFSNTHQSEYFYDKAAEKTFTFDTAMALRAKLCALKQRFVFLDYAVAAFNLEYADGWGLCGEGDFTELRALRQIVEFMHTNFTSKQSYEGCVSLSLPALSNPMGLGRHLRRGRRN